MSNVNLGGKLTGSEKTLRDYVEVLIRRNRVLLAVFAVIVLITMIYAFTRTRIYTSVATIELMERGLKHKNNKSVYGETEYDEFKSYLTTQMQILKSRSLAEALVTRMNLVEDPEFVSDAWFAAMWSGVFRTAKKRTDYVAGQVTKRISVKPMPQSNLIQISMNAADPVLASKMLSNYIELYMDRNLEKRRQSSIRSAEWLKEELSHAEKNLRESEFALVSFLADQGIVETKDGPLTEALSALNKTMEGHLKAQETRAKVEAMNQRTFKEEIPMVMPKDINNEYLGAYLGKLKHDLAEMELEYTHMSNVYNSAHPKVTLLDKKIKFLRDRIATIEKDSMSSVMKAAKTEEHLLKTSFDSAKQEASRVRSLQAQYSSLKKDVETNSEFQKILLNEYKQMDIRARTISNDIEIVDPASSPTSPSWPNKLLFLIIGSITGLIAGIAVTFIVEHWDDTIQSAREIDERFNVRRLGTVPHMERIGGLAYPEKTVNNNHYEILACDHPNTLITNAIRNIEASLLLSHSETPVQCMLVSSASPSEGKTLIATSIARSLASDLKKRVVIVDCDLRRSQIHKVFGNGNSEIGVSGYLKDESMKIGDLISSHIIPSLFYITAGTVHGDPFLLLKSDRMQQFIDELRAEFDYIVIDSPPILGLPDVPLISNKTDGVIMVAKQGQVGRYELQQAIDILLSVPDSRLLGVVLNMAHPMGRYGSMSYYRNESYFRNPFSSPPT